MSKRERWEDSFDSAGSQPLDFSASSGAVEASDAAYDADSLNYNTISSAETTLDPTEADDYWKYYNLKGLNDDKYSEGYRSQQRSQHRLFDVRHFCEVLDLPSEVLSDIYNTFEEIDVNEFGSHDAETVILSVITLIANQHDIAVRDTSPITKKYRQESFENLRLSTDTSPKEIRKVRQMLRE